MTPTLARQRGFFDGLLGRPGVWFYDATACVWYWEGYFLGAAALDPSEGR